MAVSLFYIIEANSLFSFEVIYQMYFKKFSFSFSVRIIDFTILFSILQSTIIFALFIFFCIIAKIVQEIN